MKALKVLKNVYECLDYGVFQGEKEAIVEAIAELEALENRSCKNCIQKKCPIYKEALNYSVIKSKKRFLL